MRKGIVQRGKVSRKFVFMSHEIKKLGESFFFKIYFFSFSLENPAHHNQTKPETTDLDSLISYYSNNTVSTNHSGGKSKQKKHKKKDKNGKKKMF